jgi:hypothetical protein
MIEYITPDDHFPHIDMKATDDSSLQVWQDWCKENANGATQERVLLHTRKETIVRIFFANERDAVLFKMFFL